MERNEGQPKFEENTQLKTPEKDLRDLFYLSYRYSQGYVKFQHYSLERFVRERHIVPDFLTPHIPDYISSIIPPRKHVNLQPQAAYDDLVNMWTMFYVSATGATVNEDLPGRIYQKDIDLIMKMKDLSNEDLSLVTLQMMVNADTNYQSEKRPGRSIREDIISDSNNDPHASFVREYVLHGSESGHEAFDALFGELRDMAIGFTTDKDAYKMDDPYEVLTSDLSSLAALWESNHSGERFWDDETIENK